jgi:hypothetical protein
MRQYVFHFLSVVVLETKGLPSDPYVFSFLIASSECPKRGCYDCPNYAPGENPHFKALSKEAERVRAKQLKENGEANLFLKSAEL